LIKKPYRLNRISIKTVILAISVAISIAVLFFVAIISYNKVIDTIMTNMESIYQSEAYQIDHIFETNMTEMQNITRSISENKDIIEQISRYNDEDASTWDKIQAHNSICNMLMYYKLYNSNIDSIFILTDDAVFSKGDSYLMETKFKDITSDNELYTKLKNAAEPYIFEPNQEIKDGSVLENVFKNKNIFLRRITFGELISDNGKICGGVFVVTKDGWMNDQAKSKSDFAILGSNNNVIFNGTKLNDSRLMQLASDYMSLSQSPTMNYDKKHSGMLIQTTFTNWNILYIGNMDEIETRLGKVRNQMIFIVMLCIILLIPLSKFYLDKIFGTFNKLADKSKRYRNDENYSEFKIKLESKNRITLREKITYYFLSIIFIPVLIFMITYYFASFRIIRNVIEESINNNFKHITYNIETMLSSEERLIRSIIIDQQSIGNNRGAFSTSVLTAIEDKLHMGQNFYYISIYGKDKKLLARNYVDSKDILEEEIIFDNIDKTSGELLWALPSRDSYKRWIVNAFVKILNVSVSDKQLTTLGYAKIGLEEACFDQIYGNLEDEYTDIIIVNTGNQVISNKNKNLIGSLYPVNVGTGNSTITINGNKYLIIKNAISGTPLFLMGVFNSQKLNAGGMGIIYFDLYIAFTLLLIIIILSYYISFILIKPLSEFNFLLKSFTPENLKPVFPQGYYISEVEELGKTFNDMVERIENLIDEVYIAKIQKNKLEQEKKELEQVVLQAQINPHFLCNTLENIKWMMELDEYDKESPLRMINALNNIFKYGICKTESLIDIGQEIMYTKAYIELIDSRYHKDVSFYWFIDNGILQYKVLKLTIQPLVENSIFHGLKEGTKQLINVEIHCFVKNDEIHFVIKDDGEGMGEEKMVEVKMKMNNESASKNIGLNNVNRRIKLFFGEQYGISMESKCGEGTAVEVVIPKITQ